MKWTVFILLFIITCSCEDTAAQAISYNRHKQMVEFLIKHGLVSVSLIHTVDGSHIDYTDFIYEVKMSANKFKGRASIYVFKARSAHSCHYIALQDHQLSLLETVNLASDIKYLVTFFKKNKFSNDEINNTLSDISSHYLFNKELKSEMTLETK